MARKPWWPTSMPEQYQRMANLKAKIGDYTSVFPLTAAQEAEIILIANTYMAAYTFVEETRVRTASLIDWRDDVFSGPVGGPVAAVPPFDPATMPSGAFTGVIKKLFEYHDLILELPGYTTQAGEDLMLLGEEIIEPPESQIAPDLTINVTDGNHLTVKGSMKGMNALRIEYQRMSTTPWPTVAFVTSLPAQFTIELATDGTPESGRLRGHFQKKNEDFGVYSPEYTITLS